MRLSILTVLLLLPAPAFAQQLGEETVPADEADLADEITDIIAASVEAEHAKNGGVAKRDAHAKHHGCVKGELQVEASLPAALQAGVFQSGARYKTWVRFSNGSGRSQDDKVGDGRGMAIKLVGVPGDKLLPEERTAETQDFLMINHPVFFVRNARDYVGFSKASAGGANPLSFFFPGVNPLNWRLHELNIARQVTGKTVRNPLDTPYWTMTPYLHGDVAVKYAVAPCHAPLAAAASQSPDFLREAMASHLATRGACFELLVQQQTDPVAMPLEDPTIEWDEGASPYRKLATLTIPAQRFTSEAQMEFCENLSFTPWHALPAHRPLGGINRVRRQVYETVSRLRHDLNGAERAEPTGNESFE
jgi:hypothetical protein